jgi:hypothetical protein
MNWIELKEIFKGVWVSMSTRVEGNAQGVVDAKVGKIRKEINQRSVVVVFVVSCCQISSVLLIRVFNIHSQPELNLFASPEALGLRSSNLALPALMCLTCFLPKSILVALCTPGSSPKPFVGLMSVGVSP